MTAVSSTRTIGWYRTPIGREALRVLNQRSDWKGFLQVGGHAVLIVLTGMMAWQVQDRLYLLLPTLFVYGTFYVFILNGTHELSHNSVFKTKFLNHFFLRLFCFFGWRNHVLFWESHSAHHKYTLHRPDDLEVVLPKQLTLREFLRITFFDPRTLYETIRKHLLHCVGKVEGEWENHLFPPAEKSRQLRNSARFLLVGHATLVAVFMYAAVPCYNLGKLHQLIRHDLPHCPHGLFEAYRGIIATVLRQRVEPDYQFTPELPAQVAV